MPPTNHLLHGFIQPLNQGELVSPCSGCHLPPGRGNNPAALTSCWLIPQPLSGCVSLWSFDATNGPDGKNGARSPTVAPPRLPLLFYEK